MHERIGKRAKIQRKPNGWHKASKASITTHGTEKGYASSKPTSQGCVLTNGHIRTSHERDGCNHTSTSPRGAPSMAKPKSR